MTDNDYITINENGVFVGGQPATQYRGVNIVERGLAIVRFKDIKRRAKEKYNREVSEIHCLTSESWGHYEVSPLPKPGDNYWYRLKFADGTLSRWGHGHDYEQIMHRDRKLTPEEKANRCARLCACNCFDIVRFFDKTFYTESYQPLAPQNICFKNVYDINSDDYITVTKDGIFVGGQPATHYRGREINQPKNTVIQFKEIQKYVKKNYVVDVDEMHCLSSETDGDFTGNIGNPSLKHGFYSWYRLKFADGALSPWGYGNDYSYCEKQDPTGHRANTCASNCAAKSGVIIADFSLPNFFRSRDAYDIADNDYITINDKGLFIGDKPAIFYCGEKICFPNVVVKMFQDVKGRVHDKYNRELVELHCLSSETYGVLCGTIGNPSPKHGSYSWLRSKFADGKMSPWVYDTDFLYAGDEASAVCASWCAYNIGSMTFLGFCPALFKDGYQTKDAQPVSEPKNYYFARRHTMRSPYIFVDEPTKGEEVQYDDYIVMNIYGTYVGGQPATRYRGAVIKYPDVNSCSSFKNIQDVCLREYKRAVKEVHYLASETPGFNRTVPSSLYGCFAWFRIKFASGKLSQWVPYPLNSSVSSNYYSTPEECARNCMFDIGTSVYKYPHKYEKFFVLGAEQSDETDLTNDTKNNFCKKLKAKILSFIQKQHQ